MQKPTRTPSVFVKAINNNKQTNSIDRMIAQQAAKFSVEDLTRVYNQARVDYLIPMPMAPRRFTEYVNTYSIDLDRSMVMLDTILYEVIGIGLLGLRGNRGWISRFGVVPLARGQGIGSQIMEQLLNQLADLKAKEVVLELLKESQPGFGLARKFGFEEVRELIVARRPPTPLEDQSAPDQPQVQVGYLHGPAALELLDARTDQPSWLNETETYQSISPESICALTWSNGNGDAGWVVYQDSRFQLKRVTVGVAHGDPATVSAEVLNTLHRYIPNKDATIEDMPTDDLRWPGYQAAGYFETFRRVELIKSLD